MKTPLIKYITLVLLFWLPLLGFAQETNCSNGVDDDGDGLVDCFDVQDCNCPGFYYGQPEPGCQYIPAPPGYYDMGLVFKTDVSTAALDQRSGVFVMDMDNDGIPELVGKNPQNGNIYVFNGRDGTVKFTFSGPQTHQYTQVALGDVDKDGLGDVFVTANDATIHRFEYGMASAVWSSSLAAEAAVMSPQLADFNQDGIPEVYVGNAIFDALTGKRWVAFDANKNSGKHEGSINNDRDAWPLAFDIFKNGDPKPGGDAFGPEADGLELIVGNEVYLVDLGDGTNEDSGSLTLAATVSGTNIGDGFVSIADFNGNKKADVAVMSKGHIYIWEPFSQTLLTPSPYKITNTNFGGRINIGDFNNDGDVELGAAGRNIYVALDFDANTGALTELWTKSSLQDGSQRTGSTLFDFEGDGINEVVYSDETTLYIWRGSDGYELAAIPSASGTRTEYPLVADVNGDDQAEIIIAAQGTPGPSNSSNNGFIEVYRALNRPWITARKIWNQHGYFVTNVNDDGTIPAMQQDPIIAGVNNVFNRFLVQTTILKQNGIPTYAAPNAQISFDPNTDIDLTNCPTTIDVTVTIYNTGSAALPEGVYITFFGGDPFNGTPPVLHVAQTTQVVPPAGSTTLTATFSPPGNNFQLFVLINHDGSNPNASLPISPPENLYSGVGECDYTDNSTNGAIDITGCSLTVTPCPDLAQISPVNQCAASFDLATVPVTDNNSTTGTLSYYTSSSDAYAATNALSSTVVTTSGSYYVRKDANGCYDVAEIKLTLNCTPTPQDDNLVVNINTSGGGNLLANDTDPDGDPLTAMPGNFTTAQGGTLVINTDGSYTYTPPSGYTGTDSYVYTACDDDGVCATATLNIRVNSPPVAGDDILTVDEDTPGSGDLSGNDSDVDGTLTYTSGTFTTAQGGTITINADGTYTYTPGADYNGPDSYVYQVCDDDGACATATLNITVNDVNDPPVAGDDILTVDE
ncbi:Ig-like domain-containing protein, partial [Thermonema rossianum]|uniref:Ig-like domain-containing protein n=1 Tax=Thermonema rossianum TaxID=55505 RepID=UPI00146FC55F